MVSITAKNAADGSTLLSACKISRYNMLANLKRDLALTRGDRRGQHGPGIDLQVDTGQFNQGMGNTSGVSGALSIF